MKLENLNNKNPALKALRENFDMSFNPTKLDKTQTTAMLGKVRKLIGEARSTPAFHKSQKNPEYLKLLFMEQALREHAKVAKSKKIVLESESVEKSQVILAAQDMVDTVQGMYEDVNDMLVKELPALVDSIQSQIGVNESGQFNEQVSQLLSSLQDSLKESQDGLRSALGVLTGEGGPGFDGGADMDIEPDMDADMDLDMDMDGPDMDADMDLDMDEPDEREEEIRARSVGRDLR